MASILMELLLLHAAPVAVTVKPATEPPHAALAQQETATKTEFVTFVSLPNI